MSGARVAYVAWAFPVLTQTFTVREVAALRRRGVELTVFAARRDPAASLDAIAAAEASRTVYLGRAEAAIASLAWLLRRPVRFLATMAASLGGSYRDKALGCRMRAPLHVAAGAAIASRLRAGGGCRRVHAQFLDAGSTAAFAAARLLGVAFSATNHTAYNPFLLRVKARHADRLISISEYDRALIEAECGPDAGRRTVVSRVGIDLAEWRDAPRRPEPRRVLSVGALREKKGHDVLIRAAARLAAGGRPIVLAIAGEGPEGGALRRLAGELGVAVEFLGAASPAAIRAEMTRASAFALACRVAGNGDIDGIPVAIMEAMAAGLPVVSTRLSGIPELVADGVSGLLAEPGDAGSLAAAIDRLLGDAELSASLAQRARASVAELHDLERTSERLARLLEGGDA